MEPEHPPARSAAGAAALCTAAASSLAGVFALTQSVPVTIIAAVLILGLAAIIFIPGHASRR